MTELPAGTLTFLFTDIAGSTELVKQLGDVYGEVLQDHNRLMRRTFEDAGGQEIDTQGDAFFVVFRRARDAVAAAVAIQRAFALHSWPGGIRVRVRMGIHSGEPTVAGDRYVGLAINRASRICSAASGGQILISASTFALLADDVHRNVELRDVGERLLKGIDNPERLYEVVIPGGAARAAEPRKTLRVVVADDSVLLREGVARLLADSGFEVSATVGDADALIRSVESDHPAIVITDIKMPPTHTDEGLVAAERIRAEFPQIGVLVLSQYLDSRYAARLLEQFPERVGYLLKERVSDVAVLVDAVNRIAEGECVLDPTIVSRLMQRARSGPLEGIDEQQSEVLALIAEGRSDEAIAERLGLDLEAVRAMTAEVFERLGLSGTADDLRRIAAVLAVLRS